MIEKVEEGFSFTRGGGGVWEGGWHNWDSLLDFFFFTAYFSDSLGPDIRLTDARIKDALKAHGWLWIGGWMLEHPAGFFRERKMLQDWPQCHRSLSMCVDPRRAITSFYRCH